MTRTPKTNTQRALEKAGKIKDPWARAQALARVVRYCDKDACLIANKAAKAASQCADEYQRCAVRAWEIAALAERDDHAAAFSRLKDVLTRTSEITPPASRSEALILLLQAAARIDQTAVETLVQMLIAIAATNHHWRCHRAVVDAIGILARFDGDVASRLCEAISDAKLRSKCAKQIANGGFAPRAFFT